MRRTGLSWALRPLTAVFALLWLVTPAIAQEEKDELSWPRQLDAERATILIYQPQLESYSGNIVEARAAISVTRTGETQPIFGAMWFKGFLLTNMDERIATLDRLQVTASKFPGIDENEVKDLSSYLETEIPKWDMTFSIDRLVAAMDEIESRMEGDEGFKNDPPDIIFSTTPAVLVLIDGDPILTDLEDTGLKIVVNTAFFIVQETSSKKYYLKGGDHWYVASDLKGEWQNTTSLPKSVAEVAKQVEEEEKKQLEEMKSEGDAAMVDSLEAASHADPAKIVVRTVPAELIICDGEPEMAPLNETELLYVTNTENDVVFELSTQAYFILLSGRWYKSASLTDGPWAYISQDELPAEFAKIPAESDMSQVRFSVAGTQESKEAALTNQIPQTAEVDRKTASTSVTYDGDPKFEKCSENVAYAVNTDKSVLLINNMYYCCDNAVWFVSNGPEGPWQVATEVPAEVQELPPECPAYNVKYVYIYETTPEVVYVGYTPSYYGSYYYGGVVVWGTGWWYRPWWGSVYYPHPMTWGFHVHYNPWTGWGMSFGVSYGWLHIGFGRPWYGGWWGARGYRYGYRHGYARGYRHGYHHGARAGYRAGYRAGQRYRSGNVYRNRGGVNRAGVTPSNRARTGQGRGSAGTSQAKRPQTSNRANNHYADRNGNVHRNQGGQWQQNNNNKGWNSSQGSRDRSSQQSLNRSQSSRNRGNQNYNSGRSQSRSRSGGGGGRRR